MELKLKSSKDFIEGYIQGEYKQAIKINEVLELINENLEMWCEDAILKEILEKIERILK